MKLYTLPQAAKECQLSLPMIHRAIEDGQLDAIELEGTKQRKQRVITEEALVAYKRWRIDRLGDYYPELNGDV